ncbi:multiheme c-type cytochrome [Novipirellula artificiosorum]|uniref:Cytochrome c-552/4 domain-containing protein n=1 Tax=Novipirellula artificiosorum TaxID=2528016 RepID=A0A5C6DLR4_9BACT|nr:multiheme c-type cytochrome [Novipirellula artificiosorum]TWU37125.1 hypothetical protein Poly41_32520 [Novipirellula artificiosorum]
MNIKWVALGALALAVLGWCVLSSRQDTHSDEIASQLAKREAATVAANPGKELDALTERGVGMPLPDDLVAGWVASHKYWFVGKDEDGGGVEIPFAPGQFPKPAPDLEPVNANPGFVGPQACQKCHPEHHNTALLTMHYNTSRGITTDTVLKGRFEPGKNVFKTKHDGVSFEMIKRGDRYYQRTHFYDWHFDVPMDISVGASIIGQSYLYWHGDQLYQANMTHVDEGNVWVNSPGYTDGDASFARPIGPHCLSCHGSYHDYREFPNHFTPDQFIFGVTCERCHGPGAEHIEYHEKHPDEKTPYAIVKIADLPRDKQVEVCGQCHLGRYIPSGRAFRFRPGDEFFDYYENGDINTDGAGAVHGANQLARLRQSECFVQSEMSCVDCHNPHCNEHGNTALYSERCIKCHEPQACGMYEQVDFDLAKNCIDCHMTYRPSSGFVMQSVAGDVSPPLRDHLIQIDQQATDEFLEKQNRSVQDKEDAAVHGP